MRAGELLAASSSSPGAGEGREQMTGGGTAVVLVMVGGLWDACLSSVGRRAAAPRRPARSEPKLRLECDRMN